MHTRFLYLRDTFALAERGSSFRTSISLGKGASTYMLGVLFI